MTRDDETGPSLITRILARVTENWPLKLFSIVISLTLYIFLHGSGDAQRTVEVEVWEKPPDDSGNLVRLTPIPSRVRVTVKGPRALLDDLSQTIEPVILDLSSAPTRINLADLNFKMPTGVEKLQVVPAYLTIRWDTKVTRSVPVEVTWNAPPEGLAIKNLSLDPTTIAVTGPKSQIELIQRLRTDGLDLQHREVGSHIQRLFIDLSSLTDNPALVGSRLGSDAVVKFAQEDKTTVEARFELVAETKTRTFPNLSVLVLGAKGVTLRPQRVSVVVTCPPRRADELVSGAIVPKIDLEALGADFAKKGPEEADVRVDVPGCSDVSVSPPRVAVTR